MKISEKYYFQMESIILLVRTYHIIGLHTKDLSDTIIEGIRKLDDLEMDEMRKNEKE